MDSWAHVQCTHGSSSDPLPSGAALMQLKADSDSLLKMRQKTLAVVLKYYMQALAIVLLFENCIK